MSKLEEHIKQKLQEREMRPSDGAWNKIEAKLGAPGIPTVRKRTRIWAIAASFIGILILSVLYFNQEQPSQDFDVEVVDAEKVQEDAIEVEEEIVDQSIIETDERVTEITEMVDAIPKKKTSLENNIVSKTEITDNIVLIEEQNVEKGAFEKQETIIDKKLNEILTQVTALENQNTAVTEAEVDSLLRIAQREILTDKLFEENGKVDAMALLAEVEDELDQTFRDQIFEKLKVGYLKLRTAVADRNN